MMSMTTKLVSAAVFFGTYALLLWILSMFLPIAHENNMSDYDLESLHDYYVETQSQKEMTCRLRGSCSAASVELLADLHDYGDDLLDPDVAQRNDRHVLMQQMLAKAEQARARIAEQLGVHKTDLVIPVPADGLCLSYCVVASQDVAAWMHGRNANGDRDGDREAADRLGAQTVLASVISMVEAAGHHETAARLRLAGAAGYPGMDELSYFATLVGGRIELYHLDEPEAEIPTASYGQGELKMRVGHTHVFDPDYHAAEHFVLLPLPAPSPEMVMIDDLDAPGTAAESQEPAEARPAAGDPSDQDVVPAPMVILNQPPIPPELGGSILVLKREYFDMMISSLKRLEIRAQNLAQGLRDVGHGGQIYGAIVMAKGIHIPNNEIWRELQPYHRHPSATLPYKDTYALPVREVILFTHTIPYVHRLGSVGTAKYVPPGASTETKPAPKKPSRKKPAATNSGAAGTSSKRPRWKSLSSFGTTAAIQGTDALSQEDVVDVDAAAGHAFVLGVLRVHENPECSSKCMTIKWSSATLTCESRE